MYDQICASAGRDQMVQSNADNNSGESGGLDSKTSSSRTEERNRNLSLQEISRHLEEGVVAQSWMASRLNLKKNEGKTRMPYLEIKSTIERRLAHQRGFLTREEVAEAANEWRDIRSEEELDQGVIEREVMRFNEKIELYDNAPVGSMTSEKERGKVRLFLNS